VTTAAHAGVIGETARERPITWAGVLRGLVYEAFALRDAGDRDALRAACSDIIDEHARWPLTATLLERREARAIVEARRRWIEDGVVLMRATYV
jgi:hypothetical protein